MYGQTGTKNGIESCFVKPRRSKWLILNGTSLFSRTPIVFFQSQFNTQYINEVLKPFYISYVLGNFIFQKDNSRPHTAAVTLECSHEDNNNILLWPAHLPDLSSIEHVCNMMGRRVRTFPKLSTKLKQVGDALLVTWYGTFPDPADHFIRNMFRRTAEWIASRFWVLEYLILKQRILNKALEKTATEVWAKGKETREQCLNALEVIGT